MTPTDLRAWQLRMGYTQARAAAALGVSLATYKDWLRGQSRTSGQPITIDRRTELACAALESGITIPASAQ